MDSSILKINDYVGLSFWIISMAMAAATFSFLWKEVELKVNGKLQFLLRLW